MSIEAITIVQARRFTTVCNGCHRSLLRHRDYDRPGVTAMHAECARDRVARLLARSGADVLGARVVMHVPLPQATPVTVRPIVSPVRNPDQESTFGYYPNSLYGSFTSDPRVDGIDLDHEFHAQVLDEVATPVHFRSMARLCNAWEWNEGQGNGGRNPHRHDDGYVPVYRGVGQGQAEFVIVVVLGTKGRWHVVKCDPRHVTAREFNRLTGRSVRPRYQPNPDRAGRYEIPYLWLEPLEVYLESFHEGDDELAVMQAKSWATELKACWLLEDEGYGSDGVEYAFDPEKLAFLQGQAKGGGETQLAEVEEDVDALWQREQDLLDAVREEADLG